MKPWTAALQTMRFELAAQPQVIADVLDQASAQLPALLPLLTFKGNLLSVGVGDSDLVGRLAQCGSGVEGSLLQTLKSTEVQSTGRPGLALVQSISGSTASTLAAAEYLGARGIPTLAITAEKDSQLAMVARAALVVQIPRFEPDAKVPGTITLTAPLAITQLVLRVAAGQPIRAAVAAVLAAFEAGWVGAGRIWESWARPLENEIRAVSLVADGPRSALAALGQAKLAETAGWTVGAADPETWLHVCKHAVRPGTLVVGLDPEDSYSSWYASIRGETALRGGFLLTAGNSSATAEVTPLRCKITSPPALSDCALVEQIRLLQALALHVLERCAPWCPFQLHHLSASQVKGVLHRIYSFKE